MAKSKVTVKKNWGKFLEKHKEKLEELSGKVEGSFTTKKYKVERVAGLCVDCPFTNIGNIDAFCRPCFATRSIFQISYNEEE